MKIDKPLIEELHEMISNYNSTPEKIFYYTEEEVKQLCVDVYYELNNDSELMPEYLDMWFDKVKKK